MKRIVLVVLALVVLSALPAYCDDESKNIYSIASGLVKAALSPAETVLGGLTELEKIVVTPSKFGEKLVASSCSVSTVDDEDFDRQKINTAKEAVQNEVGIDVVQTGAFQGQASVFMRGANSNQTLVLIDGVKAYDPISPNGAYNMAHLTLDNVQTIEMLRGPQSVLYGSDAIGGLISISSKKAEKPYLSAWSSMGSFYTFDEGFEMGSRSNGLSYSLSGSRLDTKGFSQAQAKKNCRERDPYDRTSLAGRIDYEVSDSISVGGTFRYIKAHYDVDQGADADDDNASVISTDNFLTLFADQRLLDWWSHSIKFGWMETKRLSYDEDSPGFDFDRRKDFGQYFKMDYENTFSFADMDKVLVGYSYTEEIGDNYDSYKDWTGAMTVADLPKVFSREGDFYIENRFNYEDRLTLTQGLRVGHHSQAGTFETYRFDGSYLFNTGTKVRGLWATGFRAPSLYQLYAPAMPFVFGGGNTSLQPEKTTSYEFGVDQYMFNERIIAAVTYFHAIYRNLIDSPYNPVTWFSGQYVNIGKSQAHGVEASLAVKPVEGVRLKGGMTLMTTKDFSNDQEMPRRPGEKIFAECFVQATEKMSFDIKVRHEGPRSDNLNTFVNTYKVKGFTVVDLVVNYDLSKNLSVFARVDNLMNKYYEEVRGYTMAPFSAYAGVKAKF